jgi:hypothetical protein
LTLPSAWLTNSGGLDAGTRKGSGAAPSAQMAAPSTDLIAERLGNQRLISPDAKSAVDVVARFGAIQAQDYPAAKWAIGLRAPHCRDSDIDHAFNEAKILRTHVLRPTWHFVAPEDIRWILSISRERVHQANAYYYRQAGLDASILSRSCAMIQKALDGGKAMARAELAEHLRRAKIPADGLKLNYLVMHAELEGIICSGPRRGRQFTYMLLDERVPASPTLDRDDAIAELTRRYFASHGPASVRDFVWWSGLTVKQARQGIEAAGPELQERTIDGIACWGFQRRGGVRPPRHSAFLLPNYDEYLIAYKDRGAVVDADRAANIVARSGGAFSHHLIIDGRLAGSWQRTIEPASVVIEVAPYRSLTPTEQRAVAGAAECYGEFLGLPASMRIV